MPVAALEVPRANSSRARRTVSTSLARFSRFVVGWQGSTSLRSDLAIDALEMPTPSTPAGQTGSRVWYITAAAASNISPFAIPSAWTKWARGQQRGKPRRLLRQSRGRIVQRLLRDRDDLSRGPLERGGGSRVGAPTWVDRFNHRRIHNEIGRSPLAELEANFYRQNKPGELVASLPSECSFAIECPIVASCYPMTEGCNTSSLGVFCRLEPSAPMARKQSP